MAIIIPDRLYDYVLYYGCQSNEKKNPLLWDNVKSLQPGCLIPGVDWTVKNNPIRFGIDMSFVTKQNLSLNNENDWKNIINYIWEKSCANFAPNESCAFLLFNILWYEWSEICIQKCIYQLKSNCDIDGGKEIVGNDIKTISILINYFSDPNKPIDIIRRSRLSYLRSCIGEKKFFNTWLLKEYLPIQNDGIYLSPNNKLSGMKFTTFSDVDNYIENLKSDASSGYVKFISNNNNVCETILLSNPVQTMSMPMSMSVSNPVQTLAAANPVQTLAAEEQPPAHSMNISNMVRKLINNVGHVPEHHCGQAAREALEAGGLNVRKVGSKYSSMLSKKYGIVWNYKKNCNERAMNYSDGAAYRDWLIYEGWKVVAVLRNNNEYSTFTSTQAQPGDIASYLDPRRPRWYGHVCMWSGKNWISYYVQKGVNCYTSSQPEISILRFTGESGPLNFDPTLINDTSSFNPDGSVFSGGGNINYEHGVTDGGTFSGGINKSNTRKGLIVGVSVNNR